MVFFNKPFCLHNIYIQSEQIALVLQRVTSYKWSPCVLDNLQSNNSVILEHAHFLLKKISPFQPIHRYNVSHTLYEITNYVIICRFWFLKISYTLKENKL